MLPVVHIINTNFKNDNKMDKKIVSFSFLKVRKDEFPDLVNGVIRIGEKHNLETLGILGMFNLLKGLQSGLDELTVINKSHPLTEEIKAERKRRGSIIVAVLSQVTAIRKANLASETSSAALVVPFMKRYLAGLNLENVKTISGRLKKMLAAIEKNAALKTALSDLGFTVYLNELAQIQQSIDENTDQRTSDLSERPKAKTKEVRNSIGTALENWLNSTELARVEHVDLDYMPLINELNEWLATYQTLIRSRTTRSKSESAKTTTVAASSQTTATAV